MSAVGGASRDGAERVDAIRAPVAKDSCGPGRRVEIHVKALIPRGRYIEVLVRGSVQLRMCRPGRDFPTDRATDLYFALPAALLEEPSTAVFSSPRLSETNELLVAEETPPCQEHVDDVRRRPGSPHTRG